MSEMTIEEILGADLWEQVKEKVLAANEEVKTMEAALKYYPDALRQTGTISYYNRERGFGFIDNAIFFHVSRIIGDGFSVPGMVPDIVGKEVTFSTIESKRGLQAVDIEIKY